MGQPSCRNVTVCGRACSQNTHDALRQRETNKRSSESHGLFTVLPFLQGFRTTNDQRQEKKGIIVARAFGEKHYTTTGPNLHRRSLIGPERLLSSMSNEPWATFDVDLRHHFFLLPFFLPIVNLDLPSSHSLLHQNKCTNWKRPGPRAIYSEHFIFG